MTPAEYLESAATRLTDAGCEVTHEAVGPVDALVGYQRTFALPAMSRIHVVTAMAHLDPTPENIAAWTRDVSQFSRGRTGALRGAQSGIGAFAVVVADQVTPEAVAAAQVKPKVEFAVRTQRVLVDLSTGEIHTFRGRLLFGFALNGTLRRAFDAHVLVPA
ncbi:hypothetical protein CLV28_1173 [Sediminihabitans luteus]|uniref:Uncharacterized protein n=1 Tax=Sediminihabitans luteus TaxID=1138585 RepID=A0A2M9D161_9CELL|nr:hypothetical protein [Sediminihabitans luteus]PJJ77946.1 hypothetical protein CLV28_1173 [Sediminihabitans luteus]GII99696.1 hypothetical protein Slu03_20740 [Sediminihabitans luteus]